MADFTIKTFDEKIHNIYITGTVGEDMWQTVVDKINDIKSADNEIIEQNEVSLRSAGIEFQIVKPEINIYLCIFINMFIMNFYLYLYIDIFHL